MALNWNSVRKEHVARACQTLIDESSTLRPKIRGIFIEYEGNTLPAKKVIGIAYLLANGLPLDTKLKFSSGENTVQRLRNLGFVVDRRSPVKTEDTDRVSSNFAKTI